MEHNNESKIEKTTRFLSSIIDSVSNLVQVCKEGENSINKRNNQLLISMNFSFGEKGAPNARFELSSGRATKEDDHEHDHNKNENRE